MFLSQLNPSSRSHSWTAGLNLMFSCLSVQMDNMRNLRNEENAQNSSFNGSWGHGRCHQFLCHCRASDHDHINCSASFEMDQQLCSPDLRPQTCRRPVLGMPHIYIPDFTWLSNLMWTLFFVPARLRPLLPTAVLSTKHGVVSKKSTLMKYNHCHNS